MDCRINGCLTIPGVPSTPAADHAQIRGKQVTPRQTIHKRVKGDQAAGDKAVSIKKGASKEQGASHLFDHRQASILQPSLPGFVWEY
jgi:hypothetical protein